VLEVTVMFLIAYYGERLLDDARLTYLVNSIGHPVQLRLP